MLGNAITIPFVSFAGVDDPAAGPFEERRPGCGKRVISQTDAAQVSIYRLEPGCGVPLHSHTRVDDFFVGLKGEATIRADAQGPPFVLRAGSCCRVARGVRHEVRNMSLVEAAVFVLVHTPYEGFDQVL